MAIKLIAIDLDGTLLKSDHSISKTTKRVIQEAIDRGVKIVICTGRPETGMQRYIKELRLDNKEDYTITNNGGLLRRTDTGEVISRHQLTFQDYRDLHEEAERLGVQHHIIYDNKVYTSNRDVSKYTVIEAYLSKTGVYQRNLDEFDPKANLSKVMWVGEEKVLDQALSRLKPKFHDHYTILRSEPYFLEFLNKNTSKGTAVRELSELLGIKREEVMAIGNAGNDYDMVKEAGIGVAVDNAIYDLKKVADYIAPSNEDEGVADAITKYVLNVE